MSSPRVYVFSGDRYAERDKVVRATWKQVVTTAMLTDRPAPTWVIEGGAVGIDALAAEVAEEAGCGILKIPYLAELGRRGGPVRNTLMLTMLDFFRSQGYTTEVLAFHNDINGSTGTKDCVKQARQRDFSVTVYTSDGASRRVKPREHS